jgi:hypothetical protein
MATIKKSTYFRFLSYMLLINVFLPLVAKNLPAVIGSFNYFWAPLWLGSLILFKSSLLSKRIILIFLFFCLSMIYIFPNIIWYDLGEWYTRLITRESFVLIICISVYMYYMTSKDFEGLAILTKIVLISIAITAVMTIISASINPLYSRMITSDTFDYDEKMYFSRLGGGTNSYGLALVLIFPILVHYYKNNIKIFVSKRIILLFGILIFVAVLRMQFFANLMISVLVIFVSLLGRKRLRESIILISFIGILSLAIPDRFYSSVFSSASIYFDPNSNTFKKMTDMSSYFGREDSKGTIVDTRASRYPMLMRAFIARPFLGNASYNSPYDIEAGFHLHWMGKLTNIGIFGFLLFVYIQMVFLKDSFKKYNRQYAFYAFVSLMGFVALGLTKTIIGRDIWFTFIVIIPGMYFLPLASKKKTSNLQV